MFKSPVARSFLSLSACLFFILVPSADAAKVTLEKQEIYSEEGELLGFHDFTAQQLDSLGVELIADYATYVAGEVSDEDVGSFQRAATEHGILFTFHPEWDTVSLNGYSFPSSGPPPGAAARSPDSRLRRRSRALPRAAQGAAGRWMARDAHAGR